MTIQELVEKFEELELRVEELEDSVLCADRKIVDLEAEVYRLETDEAY